MMKYYYEAREREIFIYIENAKHKCNHHFLRAQFSPSFCDWQKGELFGRVLFEGGNPFGIAVTMIVSSLVAHNHAIETGLTSKRRTQ